MLFSCPIHPHFIAVLLYINVHFSDFLLFIPFVCQNEGAEYVMKSCNPQSRKKITHAMTWWQYGRQYGRQRIATAGFKTHFTGMFIISPGFHHTAMSLTPYPYPSYHMKQQRPIKMHWFATYTIFENISNNTQTIIILRILVYQSPDFIS